jgi:hypothetical protein
MIYEEIGEEYKEASSTGQGVPLKLQYAAGKSDHSNLSTSERKSSILSRFQAECGNEVYVLIGLAFAPTGVRKG